MKNLATQLSVAVLISGSFLYAAEASPPALSLVEAKGKRLFLACRSCHALQPQDGKRAGPTLHRVFGRRAGQLPGYAFSPALRGSRLVWSDATMNAFLANPSRSVSGTSMAYQGMAKAEDRGALIAFLRTATR